MAKSTKNASSAKHYSAPLFKGIDLDQLHPVETVSADKAEKYVFESVDFNDPNRPKTCLEVDFPILKVNEIAAIENNATKPIYTMSKWWARRRSTVFRQLLIAAAIKAPKDESLAAQASWSLMYRKDHQRHRKFSDLKVADIFMGGGTTVVEASRLGFQVTGIDISPIAWWVVNNETRPVDADKIRSFYEYIQTEVKPQIFPFFSAKSPRGFDGHWIDLRTNKPAKESPLGLPPSQRKHFRWDGPEVIYTFWMKHIMCSDPACFHLTPQTSSSVVAKKSAKIKFFENCVCPKCGDIFDLEIGDFRMAPSSRFLIGKNETPFTALDVGSGKANCPHCKHRLSAEWIVGQESKKKKPKSKDVHHQLVISPKWLKGITGKSKDYFGGYYGASYEQDQRWFEERSGGLELIEVRGQLTEDLVKSNFGTKKTEGDDIEKSSGKLVCGKCGRQQEPLDAIKLSGHMAPVFPYLIQGFDPKAKEKKLPYGGRFFDVPDIQSTWDSIREFSGRQDLELFVPQEELWFGHQTHQRTNLPAHGYTHWKMMFNPRQLYVHSLLLKTIVDAPPDIADDKVKSQMLGAFQNYLRQNCMFTIWNVGKDHIVPHLSNNDYHPKATTVENSVFSPIGTGNFLSCVEAVEEGMRFAEKPFDLRTDTSDSNAKSEKVYSNDKISSELVSLLCKSSTDLRDKIGDGTIDLVVTDPPFGDNLNYSELADFFLVWLHKPLKRIFGDIIGGSESPKTLEAVSNKARYPGMSEDGTTNADAMYDRLLTLCWKETFRILKPGGTLVFTFHHDKDVAWIGVLESLFKAGFLIEGAFPIRSDATQGAGEFGAKKIEYDIVHICRKRMEPAKEIFWATLRKRIIESVQTRAHLLAQHTASGLHLADLEVIIRGEVLEKFSAHYGKVFKNLQGETISVKDILIEANSIAQSLLQVSEDDKAPDGIDPDTRLLLSLFRDGTEIEFGAARKRLKGSGVSLEELCDLGWVQTEKHDGERSAKLVAISDRWNSLARKKTLSSDLDQVHFAINCCLGGRQLDGKPVDWESWIESNYKMLIPSVGPLLKFIERNHFGSDYKQAIGIAYRTLERTLQRIKETDGEFKKASDQMSLFGD